MSIVIAGSITIDYVPSAPPAPVIECIVTTRYGGFILTAKGYRMAYTLPVGMEVSAQVAYVDAAGNPAVVDGAVVWASSDATVVTTTVDANDSTLVTISAIGPVGAAQVTATADADIGSGITSLVTMLDISTIAGQAVAGTITVTGTPTPIP
jgi:hypothetical protein